MVKISKKLIGFIRELSHLMARQCPSVNRDLLFPNQVKVGVPEYTLNELDGGRDRIFWDVVCLLNCPLTGCR